MSPLWANDQFGFMAIAARLSGFQVENCGDFEKFPVNLHEPCGLCVGESLEGFTFIPAPR